MPRVDLPVADCGEVQPVVAPGQIPYAAVVPAQYGQLLVEQRREYDDVLRDSNSNNREGKKLIYGHRASFATTAKMYEGRQGRDKGTGLRPGSPSSPCPPCCRWTQCHTESYLSSVPGNNSDEMSGRVVLDQRALDELQGGGSALGRLNTKIKVSLQTPEKLISI